MIKYEQENEKKNNFYFGNIVMMIIHFESRVFVRHIHLKRGNISMINYKWKIDA